MSSENDNTKSFHSDERIFVIERKTYHKKKGI